MADRPRWLIWAVIAVLIGALVFLIVGTPGDAKSDPNFDDSELPAEYAPDEFDEQATPVEEPLGMQLVSTTVAEDEPEPLVVTFDTQGRVLDRMSQSRGGNCYVWRKNWTVENRLGTSTLYRPALEILWCANRRGTKVVSINTHICKSLGGAYDYKGCDKERGALGYRAVSIWDVWHYEFGCCGVYIRRHPNVDMRISAGGRVSGTFYYN